MVVDDRERRSGIPEMLKGLGFGIDFRHLIVGDYIIGPNTAVERKSINDLVASIYNKRIFRQARELTANFPRSIILIEGNLGRSRDFTSNPAIIYGAIASLVCNYHLSVINTSTANETAQVITHFQRQLGREKRIFTTLSKPRRSSESKVQQKYLISGLPGIGETLAEKLLLNFGSPEKVFTATTGDLALVVGKNRATKIRTLLQSKRPKLADGTLQAKLP